jgi:hypothetical protein
MACCRHYESEAIRAIQVCGLDSEEQGDTGQCHTTQPVSHHAATIVTLRSQYFEICCLVAGRQAHVTAETVCTNPKSAEASTIACGRPESVSPLRAHPPLSVALLPGDNEGPRRAYARGPLCSARFDTWTLYEPVSRSRHACTIKHEYRSKCQDSSSFLCTRAVRLATNRRCGNGPKWGDLWGLISCHRREPDMTWLTLPGALLALLLIFR